MLSGKFILRLPPTLHDKLKKKSLQAGISLNQLCTESLEAALHPNKNDSFAEKLRALLKEGGIETIGIILFGSKARKTNTSQSDTDLLIVLPHSIPVERSLYHVWDKHIYPKLNSFPWKNLEPHFVHLPSSILEAGSLWFEIALEGIILWDTEEQLQRHMIYLREAMAKGEIQRKTSHGRPYWIRSPHEK